MKFVMKFIQMFLLIMLAGAVSAETVSFSNWKHQKIPFKSATQYTGSGKTLGIISDGGVSIFYTAVNQASKASWTWSVDQSVPATALKNKGGDDRNIAIYFIFAPRDQAAKLRSQKASTLLNNSAVKALVYSHGGSEARGARFMNPYMKGRGLNIVLRSAGTGTFSENVNLQSDFTSTFGAGYELIGIAISADSDDTGVPIRAKLDNLTLD